MAGRKEYMHTCANGHFHSGTHTASPMLARRALESLDELTGSVIRDLTNRTSQFTGELSGLFRKHEITARIEQAADRFSIFFNHAPNKMIKRPIMSVAERSLLRKFVRCACNHGVFMRTQVHHGISLAHDDSVLNETLRRLDGAIEDFVMQKWNSDA